MKNYKHHRRDESAACRNQSEKNYKRTQDQSAKYDKRTGGHSEKPCYNYSNRYSTGNDRDSENYIRNRKRDHWGERVAGVNNNHHTESSGCHLSSNSSDGNKNVEKKEDEVCSFVPKRFKIADPQQKEHIPLQPKCIPEHDNCKSNAKTRDKELLPFLH